MTVPCDLHALEDLFEAHGRDLTAYARILTRSAIEAEDVVQEAFLRLSRRSGGLSAVDDLRGYLFTAVRNEAHRHRSLWSRWRRLDAVAAFARAPWLDTTSGQSHGEEAERVGRAMGGLTGDQREVVFLKIWQGMTFAEIGGVLEISPNTAASRYRYAMQNLRRMLTP